MASLCPEGNEQVVGTIDGFGRGSDQDLAANSEPGSRISSELEIGFVRVTKPFSATEAIPIRLLLEVRQGTKLSKENRCCRK